VKEELREWLLRCGVGERYWEATRDKLREGGAILDYLEHLPARVQDGKGLLLLGPLGTGKTAAFALIAREAFERIPGVWYTTTTRCIRHLLHGSEMRTEWVSEQEPIGTYRAEKTRVDPRYWELLLLDEFGAAYESDWAMSAFEDYLGERYDRKLATCIAANLTPDQIRENPHYTRMVDRWRETCRTVVIAGDSMRSDNATKAARRDGGGDGPEGGDPGAA
jgi:DNA replication protein DnaC